MPLDTWPLQLHDATPLGRLTGNLLIGSERVCASSLPHDASWAPKAGVERAACPPIQLFKRSQRHHIYQRLKFQCTIDASAY